jgi:cell division protein FtsB
VKSIRTILIVVLVAALAGASFIAWQKESQLAGVKAQLAQEESAMSAQVAELKKRAADMEGQAKPLQDSMATSKSHGGSGFPAVQASTNTLEFQKLAGIQAKARLDFQYAGLFKILIRDLHLTPEKIDQFKDLLVSKQQMVADAVQSAGGPGSDPAAVQQAVKSAQAIADEQIRSQLGSAALSQYQQFEHTLPERGVIDELRQALSYTQDPLTDEQADQLIPILASTQPNGPDNAAAVISSQAVLQAKSVLSQAQFKALQQLQLVQQAGQQMDQILRRR